MAFQAHGFRGEVHEPGAGDESGPGSGRTPRGGLGLGALPRTSVGTDDRRPIRSRSCEPGSRGGCVRAGRRTPRHEGRGTGLCSEQRGVGRLGQIARNSGVLRNRLSPLTAPYLSRCWATWENGRAFSGRGRSSQAGRERTSPRTRSGYRNAAVQGDRRPSEIPPTTASSTPRWSSRATRSSAYGAIATFLTSPSGRVSPWPGRRTRSAGRPPGACRGRTVARRPPQTVLEDEREARPLSR